MGFDDSDFEKAEAVTSNTQLYKQAGNSVVVDVVQYVFKALVDCGALPKGGESMFYSDNPVADFDRYDREQERRLAELPICDICDQPIQDDHFYLINGDQVCPDCLENEFRKEID